VLYFSTTLENAIQRYSLKESRLLDCGPKHPSPPTALAVSSKNHLLISISEDPPNVYLQNLQYSSAPRLLAPQVSTTAAVCANFHPTRPNIFLLGFKDGSLGIYDATKIIRSKNGVSEFLSGNAELKAFPKLHRVFSTTDLKAPSHQSTSSIRKPVVNRPIGISSSITAACFLPGSKSEVITVGSDGKCIIVDFDKGNIVKSWHAKGPITSLSLLHLSRTEQIAEPTGAKKLRKRVPPAVHDNLRLVIAVGRVDGKVLLFDEHGKILVEHKVDESAGRVIDVEWIHGPTPEVVKNQQLAEQEYPTVVDLLQRKSPNHTQPENADVNSNTPVESGPESMPSSKEPMHSKFTEHLFDGSSVPEDETSTVRHNEKARPFLNLPKPAGYMDLFSPIKPQAIRSSPPRRRPRITSITYEQTGSKKAEQPLQKLASPKPEPVQNTTSSPKTMFIPRRPVSVPVKASSNQKRLGSVSNISSGLLVSQGSFRSSSASSRSSSNSKILAELRRLDKLNKTSGMRKTGGNLAVFAPDYTFKTQMKDQAKEDTTDEDARTIMSLISGSNQKKSRSSTGGSLKRASIGRVKVQKPTKIRRPRVPKQEAEHILLSDSGTEEPMSPKRCIPYRPPCVDGSGGSINPSSPTASSVPTYDPEEQLPRSSFSSDSSSVEDSQATISPAHTTKAPSAPPISREVPLTDTSSGITPSTFVSTTSSQVTTNPSMSTEHALRPGFAQSFEGPVEVAAYLPRRNSLHFTTPGRSPTRSREPMSELATTDVRRNTGVAGSPTRQSRKPIPSKKAAFTCAGCGELQDEIERLKAKQAELEAEVASLRRLMKGKAPA
jgi:hypothetical protein